jgi:hypothetical protein
MGEMDREKQQAKRRGRGKLLSGLERVRSCSLVWSRGSRQKIKAKKRLKRENSKEREKDH